ncbi:MAG: carbohydrate ABC transporter permease [Chloroflexaceae bacterium]|nr:carbohydrate ABC transporter permease [Chloroflexaceae bacterium]NJO06594.1 carbohydrate ABC transporter permease [Chloroflexaceae bacterium]
MSTLPNIEAHSRAASVQAGPSGRVRRRLEPLLLHTLLIIFCIIVLFPIGYVILTSLAPSRTALGRGFFNAESQLFFGHYTRLLSNSRFLVYILNSAINSIGGAALTTFCVALAGYAFARFRFRGRRALLAFLLALLMLPNLTNLIPLYKLASDLQLRDTYLIMILVYASYGVPLGIWIMKGFFESIPRELEEAAAVDGAGLWTMLWRIIIPLALPGLTSVMIINFVYNWNDFLTALILLSSTAMKTATVGLFDFQNQLSGNDNELLAAACVIIMLPGILIFLVARNAFLEGIAEGAVKG